MHSRVTHKPLTYHWDTEGHTPLIGLPTILTTHAQMEFEAPQAGICRSQRIQPQSLQLHVNPYSLRAAPAAFLFSLTLSTNSKWKTAWPSHFEFVDGLDERREAMVSFCARAVRIETAGADTASAVVFVFPRAELRKPFEKEP